MNDKKKSLYAFLQESVEKTPNKVFVNDLINNNVISFSVLWKTTFKCLYFLKQENIRKGDVVLFQHNNSWYIYPLLIASAINGNLVISLAEETNIHDTNKII